MRYFDLPKEPICVDCGYLCVRVDHWSPKEVVREGKVRFRHVDSTCKYAGKVFTLPVTVHDLVDEVAPAA